jgi:hypothetical protein
VLAVVVTRGVVLMMSVTVEGLAPCNVTGLVEGVQVDGVGRPALQVMEIEAVKFVSGVSLIG